MIKAVIFDIDNTLYSYDDAHPAAFARVMQYAWEQLNIPREAFEQLHHQAMGTVKSNLNRDCATIHSRLIRYQNLLEGLHLPIYHAYEMDHLYWQELMANMRPSPGLEQTVKALKQRGIRLGICTDMTADIQYAKLRILGIWEQVDFMVSSEELDAEKPERRLFDRCREKAGCAPGECMFVGDHLQKDVAGSLAAGMVGVWFAPRGAGQGCPPGAHTISALPQLLPLMDSCNKEETQ